MSVERKLGSTHFDIKDVTKSACATSLLEACSARNIDQNTTRELVAVVQGSIEKTFQNSLQQLLNCVK